MDITDRSILERIAGEAGSCPCNDHAVRFSRAEINYAVKRTKDVEAFKIVEPHLDYINATPELMWGLMDINLMPEQVRTVEQANALVKIVGAFQRGEIPRAE